MSTRMGWALFAGMLIAAAAVLFSWLWLDGQREARLTSETVGVVEELSVNEDVESTTTHIEYTYVVDGQRIAGLVNKAGDYGADFRVGVTAKVCFNPQKPRESDMFPKEHVCGS
jgi:hypothetical protein